MKRILAVMMVIFLLGGVATASEVEAQILPSDPDTIVLDAENDYSYDRQFDGGNSDGDDLDFDWILDATGTSDTGELTTFTFDRNVDGVSEVQLVVSTDDDSDMSTVTQRVRDEPEITITASTDIDEGDTVALTADVENAFDNPVQYSWDVDDDEVATGLGSEYTFNSAGDHTLTLTATDDAGYSSAESITVSVSDDDDDDDTSTGTGPAPTTPADDMFSELIGTMLAGDVATVDVEDDDEYGVRSVTISVTNPAQDVWINVDKQEDEPADVTVDVTRGGERAVAHFLEVSADNVENEDIDSGTIDFTVEQDWVEENDIDTDTVRLERYHDGAWEELVTTLVDDSAEELVFEAETPGFSYFAVTGESVAEEERDEVDDEEDESDEDVTDPDDPADEEDEVEDEDPDDVDEDAPAEPVEEEESLLDRIGLTGIVVFLLVIGLLVGGAVVYRRRDDARSMFRDLAGN